MPTVLITGAGRGLGLEFARQYAADGWNVIATIRDTRQAAALTQLSDAVEVHRLELGDLQAIGKLGADLSGRAIDVLLSNAGINELRTVPQSEADYRTWERTMRVNVFAPHALARAFTEHVAASERKLMVMMSSVAGSIMRADDRLLAYRSSKAALNMVARVLSVELAPRGIVVAMFHPGWVKTEMGGPEAQLDAADSVRGLRAVIGRLDVADSGKFLRYDGTQIPW